MHIVIAGVDGSLGYSLGRHLTACGHDVAGNNHGARRRWVLRWSQRT